jgi:hypothetical protein
MRTIPLHKTHTLSPLKSVTLGAAKDLLLSCATATLLSTLLTAPCPAQTLARPGWAGSGIAAESWWRNAVFYRIDLKHFQDSNGDGTGDLPGLAQRLDYLQSLGADAIIIAPPADANAFDDLLREASGRRIRIIIAFDSQTPAAEILGQARLWLTRGAAGIDVEPSLLETNPATHAAPVSLRDLRTLTNSFPGERVLIARPGHGSTVTDLQSAELVSFQIAAPTAGASPNDFVMNLHNTLRDAQPPTTGTPLFESDVDSRTEDAFVDGPARSVGLEKILATKLLTTHGAVSLLYGQELGMTDAAPATEPATMQWTPTNITPPKPEPVPEEAAKPAAPPPPSDPNVYTSFKPYVQPKPASKPKPANAPVDPNSLPGFSTTEISAPKSTTHDKTNVAVEDADPNSVLNFYRRLAQLHHDNASLRTGTPSVLTLDAENALAWIRHAPPGSRTAGNIIVICNLGDKPLALSLDSELTKLHIHPGTLRPLLASWTAIPIAQDSNHLALPAYSVYIGELYH